MGPHAGEAISLQFHPHLDAVGVRLIPSFLHALLHGVRLGQDTEQVLHVMADLMSDHVGLRELARLAAGVASIKASFHFLEERGVQINHAVIWTVEWPHGGLSSAAG